MDSKVCHKALMHVGSEPSTHRSTEKDTDLRVEFL